MTSRQHCFRSECLVSIIIIDDIGEALNLQNVFVPRPLFPQERRFGMCVQTPCGCIAVRRFIRTTPIRQTEKWKW